VIEMPAPDDLYGHHPVTGRDPGRDPIAKAAALERAVALEDDAVLAMVGQPMGRAVAGSTGSG
jgi:hypothetical protein